MANTKISALTNDPTPDDADILLYIDMDGGGAGVHLPRNITFNQLSAYLEARARVTVASIAAQSPAAATDVYITKSNIAVPNGRIKAETIAHWRMYVTKTAAGAAAPVFNVRLGTAGTTADASRGTLTFPAQTAVADTAMIDIWANFRTVGSGTSATLYSTGMIDHSLAATGFSTSNTGLAGAASAAGFDSTANGLIFGLSVNTGASAAWTIQQVQGDLVNLA